MKPQKDVMIKSFFLFFHSASVVGCFWWNEKQWIGDGPIGSIEPTDCGLNVCIPCEAAGHSKGM